MAPDVRTYRVNRVYRVTAFGRLRPQRGRIHDGEGRNAVDAVNAVSRRALRRRTTKAARPSAREGADRTAMGEGT
jgi:hypothetical protein